jgi:hypothetical protein
MTAAGAVAIGFAGLALVLGAIVVRRRRGGFKVQVWWDGDHKRGQENGTDPGHEGPSDE